jgi:hypothetical protein
MYLPNYCPKCVFDGKCHSQRDSNTTYCVTDAEHKATVFSNVCENYGVSEQSVKNFLGNIDYMTMDDDEICEFVKNITQVVVE